MKKYLIIDLLQFLRPNFGPEQLKSKPLMFSTKGINIHIDREKLKELRELSKSYTIVNNPNKGWKITLLDIREMLLTFNAEVENIVMVAMELYQQEELMAPVFRSEEFITYHVRSHDKFYNVFMQNDEALDEKTKYYTKNLQTHVENNLFLDHDKNLKGLLDDESPEQKKALVDEFNKAANI